MSSKAWATWAKWNNSIDRTLGDAQRAHAGEDALDALRDTAGKDGTASVLDVYSTAKEKAAGACWVLSPAELHKHFGSKMPHKKAIESGVDGVLKKLDPGEAIAVTCYLRGQPVAVLFAGWSGRWDVRRNPAAE